MEELFYIYLSGVVVVFVLGVAALIQSYIYEGYKKSESLRFLLTNHIWKILLLSSMSWILYIVVGGYYTYGSIFESQE